MAQMTNSLARAILKGDGVTRHELEQLCHHWLATNPEPELHPISQLFASVDAAMTRAGFTAMGSGPIEPGEK